MSTELLEQPGQEALIDVPRQPAEGEALIEGKICVLIEGKYYEADSGDYIADAIEEGFRIKDESSCNWVLQKFMDAEAQIAAVTGSPEVLQAKAILANAEAIEKKLRGRLRWLDMRFTAELGEYARTMLEGKKEKTHKTILGAISLRVKKGGVKVADLEEAIKVTTRLLPELSDLLVKTTRSFMISALPDTEKARYAGWLKRLETVRDESCPWTEIEIEAGYPELCLELEKAFTVEPDSETVTIKTGVSSK